MVRLDRVTKSFRGKPALENLTLEIPAGAVFGLLGHNGAGKSTALGVLLGQVHPDGGEALIRGISVQGDRARALRGVGAIFETPGFYDDLSGWENLEIFASFSARLPDREIEEAVRHAGLAHCIRQRVRTYSRGMRQRLALAQSLLPRPELLILDEPMEGLDPEGIIEMRELIRTLAQQHGLTVVLASHLLAEVEHLCDRIAILHTGRLVFEGSWASLEPPRFRLEVDDWERAARLLVSAGAQILEPGLIALAPPLESATVIELLVRGGIRVHSAAPVEHTLEDFYLGKTLAS